jgi:hypothetical protein
MMPLSNGTLRNKQVIKSGEMWILAFVGMTTLLPNEFTKSQMIKSLSEIKAFIRDRSLYQR